MNRAILVKSCQRFRARQEACIATWAGELRREGVRLAIVEGGFDRQCGGPPLFSLAVGDDYNSNSLKLREALLSAFQFHPGCDAWFICDDDTFVHPGRWLAHEPEGDFECRLYHPQSPKDHKLNYGRPWASGGGGWWMSRRMCELYVEHVTECCSYDDVLAARVAQDQHVEIVDRPDLYGADRYSGEAGQRVAADNRLITSHHVQPAEMVKLWEATRGL